MQINFIKIPDMALVIGFLTTTISLIVELKLWIRPEAVLLTKYAGVFSTVISVTLVSGILSLKYLIGKIHKLKNHKTGWSE